MYESGSEHFFGGWFAGEWQQRPAPGERAHLATPAPSRAHLQGRHRQAGENCHAPPPVLIEHPFLLSLSIRVITRGALKFTP